MNGPLYSSLSIAFGVSPEKRLPICGVSLIQDGHGVFVYLLFEGQGQQQVCARDTVVAVDEVQLGCKTSRQNAAKLQSKRVFEDVSIRLLCHHLGFIHEEGNPPHRNVTRRVTMSALLLLLLLE